MASRKILEDTDPGQRKSHAADAFIKRFHTDGGGGPDVGLHGALAVEVVIDFLDRILAGIPVYELNTSR
ncbi:MAG TPA: hypothetical protein VH601_08910 [Bryobacteraceae bacterium]